MALLLLPDRDTVRSRGRRRRSRERSDSLGEGCSYSSSITEIGSPSRVQQSSTEEEEEDTIDKQCTCSTSSTRYTRSRRTRLAPLAAASLVVSSTTATPLHASASPVDVEAVGGGGRMDNDNSRKGKGRATASTYEDTSSSNTYWNDDINSPLAVPRQYSLEYSRLGKRDLAFDGDSPASSSQQRHQRRRAAGASVEGQRLSTRRSSTIHERSNTPEGVPSHYEYIDGEWVPSPDWSLNGQNGMRHASSSTTTTTSNDDDDDANNDENSDGGPSTRKNHASSPTPTAAIASGNDDSEEVDLGDGESTTLGWAKSTNAILGVDIDTSLSGDEATAIPIASSSSSSSHGTLASSNNLVTRSNMATYTTVSLPSSSTASATAAATSVSTGSVTDTSSNGNGNNGNNGQAAAYDFSRDVPNGWVSDGRTAAYAVPVIIGMSVFLALVIFGLILVLLRMNKSRKKRRKANLNGGLKLSEEGKVAAAVQNTSSRPSSPALSTSNSTTRRSMSDSGRHGGGMSTSVQRRTTPREDQQLDGDGDEDENENENRTIRRRIGRKWTPNLSNGSLLRKRRKKIAQLFRRDDNNNEAIQEIIVDDNDGQDGEDTNNDGQAERMTSRSSEVRDTAATNNTSLRRRRSVSSGRSNSTPRSGGIGGLRGEALQSTDALSRVASHPSSTTRTSAHHDGDTTYIRPPSLSLQVDTANPASATTTTTTITAENDARGVSTSPLQQEEQRHIRNDSIDNGDHHAVPIPSIGPPAYMQPSTPAYSRAAPLPTSSTRGGGGASSSSSSSAHHHHSLSTTSGSIAVPASGYLSAVSTPGLLSAGMDEKRALLGGAGLMTNDASAGGDAFANQRRFEHLYSSREGEDDRLEQMTGAPAFISSSTSTPITAALAFASASALASSSSSRRNPDLDDGESDEAIARRAQQEAIDDHRRELQESLAGHVALSDKEVLSRLRMAASAPSTVVTDDGTTSSFEQPMASSPSLSVPLPPNGYMQEASAPSLDEAEEVEEEEELRSYLGREEVITGASSSIPHTAASSMLPQPPKPFTHALHQIPQVDEKTRLRQAEERQMAASFSPILDDHRHHGLVAMSPSAPPVLNTSLNASAPSAPVFDEVDQVEYVPSAPPIDMATIPSAPEFVLEDEEEDEDVEQRSSNNLEDRPYNEGVV